MIQLVITPRAIRDRDDILRYLAKEGGRVVVRKYAQRFRDAIARFADMPAYGAPRPELGPDCRVAVVAPYLVVYNYEPAKDRVTLLRIMHCKRGLTERLLRR